MVAINLSLADDVKEFLDSGDRAFLTHLLMSPRDDIESQAVVRYLMQIKHWPFTPESDFAKALDHLFGEYPGRVKRDPKEYQDTTFALIKETFGYECIVVVPEPRPEPKPNPGKVTRRPKMVKEETVEEEGESGSRTFKSLNNSDIDTTGASERLKRTIAIQRGS